MNKIKRYEIVKVQSKTKEIDGEQAIVMWLDDDYEIAKIYLPDLGKYTETKFEQLTTVGKQVKDSYFKGHRYEISSDLIDESDMQFFEGVIRIPDSFWKVLIISKESIETTKVELQTWKSGIEGLVIKVPLSLILNKELIESCLSNYYKNESWKWVEGPDSMSFR